MPEQNAAVRASSRKPKLAEQLARTIESEIAAKGWPVGEVLGSESELLERYKVSRAVLREAVRLLERQFVATMRRGPGGGLVVTAPDLAAIVRAMTTQLAFSQATVVDLFEARAAIELMSVQLVCDRLDEAGVADLREAVQREQKLQESEGGLGMPDVHLVVARLTRNPAIEVFTEVLSELTQLLAPTNPEEYADEHGPAVHHAHSQIAEAIIAGDSPLAHHRMLRHLEAMADFLRMSQPS
jgi:DNA-binding FadR family transcriptional regulator